MDSPSITLSDMTRLSADPSAETRAQIAGKIAANLSSGAFSGRESALALDIVRALARDVEVRVRAALAAHIGDCLTVPRDVVLCLARDVADVSVPLLARSYILSEDDLIAIVRATRELTKLTAIARRESISAGLAEALLETDIVDVMHALLSNPNAALEDAHVLPRWERLRAEPMLLSALVSRGGLSLRVAEKLYAAVSDELKVKLASMYALPMALVEEGVENAREWALAELAQAEAGAGMEPLPLSELIERLHACGRLSCSLVIRALCAGDLEFFEAALAKLAGIPRAIARILLLDRGPLGFRSLYARAGLPEAYYPALRALLEACLEETHYGRFKRQDFGSRVRARIQAAGYDRTVEHMDYLLTLIQRGGVRAAAETV